MRVALKRVAECLAAVVVAAGLPARAQQQLGPSPFPVILVDSAVRARLIEEWAPTNRYQHERAYCVRYRTEVRPATLFNPSVVVYTLTGIIRANETGHTANGVAMTMCANDSTTTLHIHTPAHCGDQDVGDSCSLWNQYAHQCFPSPLDVAGIIKSSRPFELIQCDQWALVPFFRRLYAN